MRFVEIDIEIPAPRNRRPGSADSRRATVSLPELAAPTLVAQVFYYTQPRPIHHEDGVFYSPLPYRSPDAETALNELFALPHYGPLGVLCANDLGTLAERFAVHDGTLMERIHEPVWVVETRDTGGRMNVRENAKHEVSLHLSVHPTRSLQTFVPRAIPIHGSPCTIFSGARFQDAQRLLPAVANDTGWGQVGHLVRDRLEILRPDLFVADDKAISVDMAGAMLVNLGHAACSALSRAGIERWIELRRLIGAGPGYDYAAIQDFAAGLLREVRDLRSSDKSLDVVLKRTRNCAAMLVHRLDMDRTYAHDAVVDDCLGPLP